MNIAYVRVSTVEQNEARQIEALERLGIDKWFTEKVSAKDTNRPMLQQMMYEFAREGDTIYIHDFSRLARNTEDLLRIIRIFNEKGITLISIKENLDSSTATGKLMLTIMGAINEFERANLLERQKEGIAIAKRNGVYKGRKEIKVDNFSTYYQKYLNREIASKQELADLLNVSRPTLDKLIKNNGKKEKLL